MDVKAVVLYANDADITFDLDYYLKSHMQLVQKTWTRHGLQCWDVVHFNDGPDGVRPPFYVQATLIFKDGAGLQSALADADTAAIFGDVSNFTNKSPIFVAGPVVGKSQII